MRNAFLNKDGSRIVIRGNFIYHNPPEKKLLEDVIADFFLSTLKFSSSLFNSFIDWLDRAKKKR